MLASVTGLAACGGQLISVVDVCRYKMMWFQLGRETLQLSSSVLMKKGANSEGVCKTWCFKGAIL